jgi:lipopolysaccharide transport system ATP-binding protein
MKDIAIRAEKLSKQFRIGARQESYRTLRDTVAAAATVPFRAIRACCGHKTRSPASVDTTFWALKGVSFEIRAGEIVGLIGRNGAGKSTVLKILSRITEPTDGFAEIRGRVGSLLEVGTGFHPELTGRENVLLNGAILGMKKAEVERNFDEIVAFAEVEKFIDTPVKHYSSGMYLRLAFAVAAHLEPEILLVDEVLAVGDAAFQKKCIGKMGDVAQAGRTVLFVSHNMSAVQDLCKRVIWINDGLVMADGEPEDVTQAYLSSLADNSFHYFSRSHSLTIEKIALKNSQGEPGVRFRPGEDLVVEIWFHAARPIKRPYLWLTVEGLRGSCFAANMLLDGHRPKVLEGSSCIVCTFKSIPLLPQTYRIKMSIRQSKTESIMDPQEVATFRVDGDLSAYGFTGDYHASLSKSTPVVVPYEWLLPDGSSAAVNLNDRGCRVKPAGFNA